MKQGSQVSSVDARAFFSGLLCREEMTGWVEGNLGTAVPSLTPLPLGLAEGFSPHPAFRTGQAGSLEPPELFFARLHW